MRTRWYRYCRSLQSLLLFVIITSARFFFSKYSFLFLRLGGRILSLALSLSRIFVLYVFTFLEVRLVFRFFERVFVVFKLAEIFRTVVVVGFVVVRVVVVAVVVVAIVLAVVVMVVVLLFGAVASGFAGVAIGASASASASPRGGGGAVFCPVVDVVFPSAFLFVVVVVRRIV